MIGLLTAPPTPTGRFRMANVRPHRWPSCRYCGRAQANDCARAQCLACGNYVCHGGGSTCPLCFFGLIPGWSGVGQRVCGYKECDNKAVARAPRVGFVCLTHTHRAKDGRGTVAENINRAVHEAIQAKPPYNVRWRHHVWMD